MTLFTQRGYQNKAFTLPTLPKHAEGKFDISKYGEITGSAFRNLPEAEKKKLADEANIINNKNR